MGGAILFLEFLRRSIGLFYMLNKVSSGNSCKPSTMESLPPRGYGQLIDKLKFIKLTSLILVQTKCNLLNVKEDEMSTGT